MNLTDLENAVRSAKVVARRPLKTPTAEQAATNHAATLAMLRAASERKDKATRS